MAFFTPFAFRTFNLDTDAQAFITAAEITDTTIIASVNNLVIDLKNNNLWNKLIALYPFVGGTASSHKWNLKDPRDLDAAFRLTFFGTPTHNANGVIGNGTDAYYNTHIIPASHMAQDDVSGFVYNRTNTTNVDFGAFLTSPGAGTGFQLGARNPSDQFVTRCMSTNAGISTSPSNTDSIGFYTISRLASGSYTKSKNKTHTTVTNTSVAPVNLKILGLNVNIDGVPFVGGWTTRNHALIGFGEGLTTGQIETLVDINETFQTSLGRFV